MAQLLIYIAEENRNLSDREELTEDSFTIGSEGNSSTTNKENTTTSHKKCKGLYSTFSVAI